MNDNPLFYALRNKLFTSSLPLLVCLLIFCSKSSDAQPKIPYSCHDRHQVLSVLSDSEYAALSMGASQERSDTFDILHYDIIADLTEGNSGRFIGTTEVRFSAKMENLDYINLDLLKLEVDSVISEKGNTLNYTHRDITLAIELDTVLSAGQEYALTVFYAGKPYRTSFGGFYFEDGYYYNLGIGIDDSPHNMGRAWYPCFDNFVERSTYSYHIVTNNGYRGFGVGTFLGQDSINSSTIQRNYRMDQQIPTYLSHIAAQKYIAINTEHLGKYGMIPIQLVTTAADQTVVETHFNQLPQAIDCLEEWYGPYVWERVGYHMTTRGAMEHPTGIAYPIGTVRNGLNNSLMTHELAHCWWGDLTTLQTEADMWFKEGNASYAEHLLQEWIYGKEAYENAVRVNNVSVLQRAHIEDGAYLPLSPMPEDITYGMHTYDKGAAMIHNLRAYLGDSLYRVGMQHVLLERAYSYVDASLFKDLLEEATEKDLQDFFDDWIFSPGWSDFYIHNMRTEAGGSQYTAQVQINQVQHHSAHFHNNVPLNLYFFSSDGEISQHKTIASDEETEVEFTLDFRPVAVSINIENGLNLAQSSDKVVFNDDRVKLISGGGARLVRQEVDSDTTSFAVLTHHYSLTSGAVPDGVRMSDTHFWHLSNPLEIPSLEVSFLYNGLDDTELDYELMENSEDSLLILYREDATQDWRVIQDFLPIVGSPFDLAGSLLLRSPQSGDYAIGKGDVNVSLQENTNHPGNRIFPNPGAEVLYVDNVLGAEEVIVYNQEGKLVLRSFLTNGLNILNISNLTNGYYSLVSMKKKEILNREQFVIQAK